MFAGLQTPPGPLHSWQDPPDAEKVPCENLFCTHASKPDLRSHNSLLYVRVRTGHKRSVGVICLLLPMETSPGWRGAAAGPAAPRNPGPGTTFVRRLPILLQVTCAVGLEVPVHPCGLQLPPALSYVVSGFFHRLLAPLTSGNFGLTSQHRGSSLP